MEEKANLAEKLSMFSDRFAPRTVAEFNGHDVMVTKLEGEFIWHSHEDTDDLFLVLKGRLAIRMRGSVGRREKGEAPTRTAIAPQVSRHRGRERIPQMC